MIALIGLLLGVFLGLVFDVNIPESFSPYMSVAILACLDSVFGAFRASLNNNFKSDIFISGFFGNALLHKVEILTRWLQWKLLLRGQLSA